MKSKIFTNIKTLTSSVVLALGVSSSASAVNVDFATFSNLNGIAQLATDGSGLTSAFVPASNIITPPDAANGYFVETFDHYDQQATNALTPSANNQSFNVPGFSDGCAINSAGVGVTASQPGVGNVRKGSSKNVAATPLNDETCYAYTTPGADNGTPSFIEINYSAFLQGVGSNVFIDYLGFYMGSVDTYNSFEFYKGGSLLTSLSGSQILNTVGGQNGSQTDEGSNVWVQLSFTAQEAFDTVRIISSGIAGEFDNITIGLDNRPERPVPAPTGLAILGLGLLGMGVRKRYSK